uniref:Peptidoglycan-recognition protein n=1 Tax=Eptatretus burgeri TaxID=7764 RepID=A0A8C4QIX1_EPTBU
MRALGRRGESPLATMLTICIAQDDFEVVNREEWGARSPNETTTLTPPQPLVIIHHTNWNSCWTLEQCKSEVRKVQDFHMDVRNWWDIGYNFLVGEDGRAYEGRGWTTEGAHAEGYNNCSIGISVMGTFEDAAPNITALHTLQKIITFGVTEGFIDLNYTLYGHRQTGPTDCPGQTFYNILQNGSHWKENPNHNATNVY